MLDDLAGIGRPDRAERELRPRPSDRPSPRPHAIDRPRAGHDDPAGNPLIETITSRRPGRPRPADPGPARRAVDRRGPRGLRRAGGVPPGRARTSTSGSGPRCSCTRSTATGSRTSPDLPAGGADPVRRVHRPDGAAVRAGDRRVPGGRCAATGPNGTIASALAQAYEQVTYQTLADQVRRSVRSCQGNRWMFRVGAGRRAPDPASTPGSWSGPRTTACSRSWSSGRRSGSTCRTRPGPTSSSSGWTTPRGPGS